MKSKEIAFTLPLVIIVYEFTFFKSSLRRKLLFLLPVLLTLIIVSISVLRSDKSLGEMLSDVSESTRLQTSMPRWDYLMTQMRVITTYIRLIVLPINQNLDYDYPIEHSIFTPPVFFSFLFLSAIFGTALYLLSLSRQGSKGEGQGQGGMVPSTFHHSLLTDHFSRLIAFGILWFFITLSVESSLIPIRDVIFEHRMYLPSVGLFAAITTAVFLAAQRLRMERIAISILVLTTLIFSGVTYARNTVWMSKITFWEDIIKKSPNKPRAHNNLGAVYYSQGRMEDALREFQLALRIKPDFADAHNNLGSVYAAQGLMDKATREFQSALLLKPDYADAHYNLGKFYFASGRMDEALREFQAAVKLKPDYADAHNNLGAVYETLGRVDDALREYQTSLQIDPGNIPARKNLERQNKTAGDRS
jgi:cytochrome c-type biogenesis protein CcmH/NrfG